jgi:hypothetical protein
MLWRRSDGMQGAFFDGFSGEGIFLFRRRSNVAEVLAGEAGLCGILLESLAVAVLPGPRVPLASDSPVMRPR